MKRKFVGMALTVVVYLFSGCNDTEFGDVISKHSDLYGSKFDFKSEIAFPNDVKDIIEYENGIILQKSKDGKYIWQGDILLSDEQVRILTQPQSNNVKTKSGIINILNRKWTGGVVYYQFATNITPRTKQCIEEAMKHWSERTPIQFSQRSVGRAPSLIDDYIEFINDSGCWSHLGMVGGKQQLSIDDSWGLTGNAIHEIGHAIGLIHEQCRSDRDQYINIDYNNIYNNWKSQYNISTDIHLVTKEEFDINSIMIYPSAGGSSSINPNIPVMTTKSGKTWIGQRNGLTELDIKGVSLIYGYKEYQILAAPDCELQGSVIIEGNSSSNNLFKRASMCTLKVLPNSGYAFEGWYENNIKVSSSQNYSFTVTNSRSLEARFKSTTGYYDVSVFTSAYGRDVKGTVTGTGKYMEGTYCTVTVSNIQNGSFLGWFDEKDARNTLSSLETYTFKVDKSIIIGARLTSSGTGPRPPKKNSDRTTIQ